MKITKRRAGLPLITIAAAIMIVTAASISRAGDAAGGRSNYATYCVKCHGETGKGDGPGAATLQTKPRDFTDCARMQKLSDDQMFKVIKEGGKANGLSGDMQAWHVAFEDNEIHDLVAYLRTFCKK